MNRAHPPFIIAVIVMLATSACLVALPAPVSAPANTLPATLQTGGGLALLTATFTPAVQLIPTQTITVTLSPFPSITPLPSATSTSTETPIGFVPSITPIPPTAAITPTDEPPDSDEGATDDWGSPTRCSLISRSPAKWSVLKPNRQYKISWTLLNSGIRTWQANEMILVYYDGAKLTLPTQKKSLLSRDVKVGQTISPVITITTPSSPGHYRAVWALRLIKTGRVFCTFTIKIIVE